MTLIRSRWGRTRCAPTQIVPLALILLGGPALVSGDLPAALVSPPAHSMLTRDATERARSVEPLGAALPLSGAATDIATAPAARGTETLSPAETIRPTEPAPPIRSGK